MKRISLLPIFILISTILIAQERVDLDIIYKIKQEGLQNSKVMETAFYLTDVSGSRLTGSDGLKIAGDWAVNQLSEWGLQNANLEKWGEFGKGWDIDKSYVAMKAPYYQPLIAFPKAWTPGTNGEINGEVVVVAASNDEELEAFKGKLTGKIILIKGNDPETSFDADARRFTAEQMEERGKLSLSSSSRFTPAQFAQFRARRAFARKISEFVKVEGAILVITSRRGKHGTFFTSNGASYAEDADPVVPELEMAPEHANRMGRLIEKGIKVELIADIQTTFHSGDLSGYNVIAEIPGTDKNLKDEIVMLGGHLDSWHAGTGATDNASGCAVMMEAVRILKAINIQPRRTIRIALWSGEEQGIHGSRNYVANHFGDRNTMKLKPDHDKFSGYFNVDNGTGRIRGVYLQGNDAMRPIFEEWFKPFNDMIDNTTIAIRNTGGTDHLAFDAVGLPGFQFIQDPIEYGTRTHHTNMDTYERLVESDLKQMSVIVASFVYNTAMRDQKLPRKPLPKPRTTGL